MPHLYLQLHQLRQIPRSCRFKNSPRQRRICRKIVLQQIFCFHIQSVHTDLGFLCALFKRYWLVLSLRLQESKAVHNLHILGITGNIPIGFYKDAVRFCFTPTYIHSVIEIEIIFYIFQLGPMPFCDLHLMTVYGLLACPTILMVYPVLQKTTVGVIHIAEIAALL